MCGRLVHLDPVQVKFEVQGHGMKVFLRLRMHVTRRYLNFKLQISNSYMIVCRVLRAKVVGTTSSNGFVSLLHRDRRFLSYLS